MPPPLIQYVDGRCCPHPWKYTSHVLSAKCRGVMLTCPLETGSGVMENWRSEPRERGHLMPQERCNPAQIVRARRKRRESYSAEGSASARLSDPPFPPSYETPVPQDIALDTPPRSLYLSASFADCTGVTFTSRIGLIAAARSPMYEHRGTGETGRIARVYRRAQTPRRR